MKTLTLSFDQREEVGVKLTGLSMKIVRGTRLSHHLCRAYELDGHYYIDLYFNSFLNERTMSIKKEVLVTFLIELYGKILFNKIKIVGNYELSGEQLMIEILKNNKYDF